MYAFKDFDLQTDAWKENSMPRIWGIVDQAWSLNPMCHPTVFSTFDSRFFGTAYKENQCVYMTNNAQRYPMLGREANYYFQGLIFAAFKQPKATLRSFMFWWKQSYVVQGPVLGQASALHQPSTNDYFMALVGYDDHPWYLARRGPSDSEKMGFITHQRGFGSYWLEASQMAEADQYYTTAH